MQQTQEAALSDGPSTRNDSFSVARGDQVARHLAALVQRGALTEPQALAALRELVRRHARRGESRHYQEGLFEILVDIFNERLDILRAKARFV